VFLSGQVGNTPAAPTQLVEGGLEAEARQIFTNLGHVLKVGWLLLSNISLVPSRWIVNT